MRDNCALVGWVVWMSIGINDGIAGTNISTFKTNLTTYINNIKADLPGAVIIMTQFQSMPANSGYPAINAALSDVADEEANVYVVDTTTATGTDGANHWTYAGLKTVASLMVTPTKNALGMNYPGKPTSLGATPASSSVALSWTAPVSDGGSSITDYVIEYKTNASTTWSTFADGTSTGTSATVTGLTGNTDYNFRVSTVNANGSGNYTTVNASTTDGTAPTISSVVATPSSTSVSIAWNTDEISSSIIEYGLTNSYGTTTSETDTSPRVTSHVVSLSNLVACTTYNYRVKSNDAASNLATGSNNTFTTTGCTGSASVTAETTTSITTASGGTSTLTSGATGLTLTIPAGATGSNAVYQIKSLDQSDVLSISGTPTGVRVVGSYAFDLKSLTGVGTAVTSFLQPITITLTYQDADLSGINESSLVIYRWNGTSWNALTDCAVDGTTNTVTCTTTHFSVFSLFGTSSNSATTTGGYIHYGCKDPKATNYEFFARSNPSLCTYTQKKEPASTFSFTRNLSFGMAGNDVKKLQEYLNTHGFVIAPSGPGSVGNETTRFGPATRNALIAFQKAKGITPSVGYFGPKTRELVNKGI